eukprot:11338848-Alexandrium_andersonii.AAC.1
MPVARFSGHPWKLSDGARYRLELLGPVQRSLRTLPGMLEGASGKWRLGRLREPLGPILSLLS